MVSGRFEALGQSGELGGDLARDFRAMARRIETQRIEKDRREALADFRVCQIF
jgi:hypothetical protein